MNKDTDQHFGGSFNAHKHWRKLKAKHEKNKKHQARGGNRIWKPEVYSSTGAGKGDVQRESDTPKEIYDLNYDLAFGKITKAEHEELTAKFWEEYNS